jgi:cobyrinic acid a,c-diamide synthase
MRPFEETATASGFVIGGLHGSSGKTVVTCLLAAGLQARGGAIQTFKAGPDFLDTGYHSHFCNRPARNLDAWMMGRERILEEARAHTWRATGILEGVMGLFDGASATSESGSTMELSRWLGWPVVLCLPAAKAGRSLGAMLRGFIAEAAPHGLAGVVLNGVSGNSHAEYLREAIRPLGIPVLGAIPQNPLLAWPERHLGLQAAPERTLPTNHDLARLAAEVLDLESFERLAKFQDAAPTGSEANFKESADIRHPKKRIAIAMDAAFHFYYASNVDWLREQGAELLPFSPIDSQEIPRNADALLIGGGFPEVHAQRIADNAPLRSEIRSAIKSGLPCYAECGGLMFLAENLRSTEGEAFPMCGVLPGDVAMTRSLQNFGYCTATDHEGMNHLGHEFHHSQWLAEESQANAWTVKRNRTGRERLEGFQTPTLHASYVHTYFPNSASFLKRKLGLSQ